MAETPMWVSTDHKLAQSHLSSVRQAINFPCFLVQRVDQARTNSAEIPQFVVKPVRGACITHTLIALQEPIGDPQMQLRATGFPNLAVAGAPRWTPQEINAR